MDNPSKSHEKRDGTHEKEKRVRQYFLVSIIAKGLISLGEIIVGILILVVPFPTISAYLVRYANGELLENSSDLIAPHIISAAHAIALVSSVFVAVYLLTRGVMKLALIVALLKDKLWAYPISIIALCLLMAYQVYQICTHFSWTIVALTAFDLVVAWSIWLEYRVLKAKREHLTAGERQASM